MPTSHDTAHYVKAISEVLSIGLGKPLSFDLAVALSARLANVFGPAVLTEAEALSYLSNPLRLDFVLTEERVLECANNMAGPAWMNATEGREVAA